jgi:hypothetical protein
MNSLSTGSETGSIAGCRIDAVRWPRLMPSNAIASRSREALSARPSQPVGSDGSVEPAFQTSVAVKWLSGEPL